MVRYWKKECSVRQTDKAIGAIASIAAFRHASGENMEDQCMSESSLTRDRSKTEKEKHGSQDEEEVTRK